MAVIYFDNYVYFGAQRPKTPFNSDPGVLSCACLCVYLLDITLYVEWQVEKELEPLQDVEGVAGGVRFVLPSQHLLEQSVRSVARPYQAEQQTQRGRERERGSEQETKQRERDREQETEKTERERERDTNKETDGQREGQRESGTKRDKECTTKVNE